MKELISLEKLIESFKMFPSIGEKTAERMAYAVLNMNDNEINSLIESIEGVKQNIHFCSNCGMLTENDVCEFCLDPKKDHSTCVVVSSSKDVFKFEESKSFNGVYHILGGDISPSKGITPQDLRFEKLLERIEKENIKEIIIATNPTMEGETTALYLLKLLEKYKDLKVSRIAFGLPIGGQIDYVDDLTIKKALEGRTKLK